MAEREVMDWLLEPSQPAIRFRTLTELLGRPSDDPLVREVRAQILEKGWAADILAERDPGGWWVAPEKLYTPKYRSTTWKMLVLSDLGLTRDVPAIRESCELWIRSFPLTGGGFGGNSAGKGHHCIVGNMARALIRFGYGDDPRVRRTLEWLVETADPKGGWSCWGKGRNLDSWEGLSAIAEFPTAERTPAMQAAADRGIEFYLERELHLQGEPYAPWDRLHYPLHYYYDVLVGLELTAAMGRLDDMRATYGLTLLRSKRRRDGRWNLDAVHPDVEAGMAAWYAAHPRDRPVPLALEEVGAPSKMITFRALKVLARAPRCRGTRRPPPARNPPARRPRRQT